MTDSIDWSAVRAEFPACSERTWLNTASYGPGPRRTLVAVQDSLDQWARGLGDWRAWEQAGEEARAGFARLVHTVPANIALLSCVSTAASQVAAALGSGPTQRKRVVCGAAEFRSNLFPWLSLEARGFDVQLVPSRSGAPRTDELVAAIDERTALVAISAVQSATGHRADLSALGAACRHAGAELFVDGTQAVGALDIDLDDCDYLAVSGYKWLLAPRGTTFLYVAPRHHARIAPLSPGWKTPADPYAEYYGPPYLPASDASRFDLSLAWPSWVGAVQSLALLEELGSGPVESRVLSLAARFGEALASLDLAPLFPPDESSQIVSLAVPDPTSTAEVLAEHKIDAAVRDRYLRVAFHFFNDEHDVDRALEALATATRGGATSARA